MSNLAKAVMFAAFAFLWLVCGVMTDIRQMKHHEGKKFAFPLVLFSSGFVCAGVGILLLGEYLLTPQ